MKLTKKQFDYFKLNGFLVISNLYNEKKVNEISQWTDEITNYPEVPYKYMMYFEDSMLESGKRILSRIEDIEPFHQKFSEFFIDGEIQQIVSQLFGEKALLFKDKINFKMPGGNGFKAHQDIQAGWGQYAKLHITALVSIDPSTIENGCLEIAAGRHNKGLIGEEWKPLEENALKYVSIPTNPGDAIFHHCEIIHGSSENTSGKRRRGLTFQFKDINSKFDNKMKKKYLLSLKKQIRKRKEKN